MNTDESKIFDPFDMDREEFNPELCLLRFTQECSLQNLLSRKIHIDNEVRGLSDDMQNLLYDNYGKFINATSVVSNMKTDFEKMQEEINLLQSKMDETISTSSVISQNLRSTDTKISQLLKSQSKMKKLVLLTDLVPKLKEYVMSGSYIAAAKHYLKAKNILEKYQHSPSLCGILKECSEILGGVKDALKEYMDVEIYGREELSEVLNLLLELGECPYSILKSFFHRCDNCLISHLNHMNKLEENKQKESCNDEMQISISVSYINLCCSYVERIKNIMEIVKDVFLIGNNETSTYARQISEVFVFGGMDNLSLKLREYCKKLFNNIDDYFLSQLLDKFSRQCYTSEISVPGFSLFQKGIDIILKICSDRCQFHLQELQDNFSNCLMKLKNELSTKMLKNNLYIALREATEHKLTKSLKAIVSYICPEFRCCREISFRKVFCRSLVHEGLFVAYFRYINEEIWQTISNLNLKEPWMTPMCFMLSKYLLDLHSLLPQFFSEIEYCLCSTSANATFCSPENVVFECRRVADKILKFYVNSRHQDTALVMYKNMRNTDWMMSKEPIRPRPLIKALFYEIQNMKIEIEKIYGPCKFPARNRTNDFGNALNFRASSIDDLSDGDSIEKRVIRDKLFMESPNMSNEIKPDSYSVINCLLTKTLKSYLECVRLNTFNHFGFQQTQVDICYFQLLISKIFVTSYEINSVFNKILSSALNRTLKPEFMNCHMVSAICRSMMQ